MAELFHVDLNKKPLREVLHWVATNRLSCVVTVTLDNDDEMTLCLEDGEIVYVSSPKEGYRLGEFLVSGGALSAEALPLALEESRRSGMSLTRYLIEQSLLSAGTLGEALEQLVEKILIEVFVSRTGSVVVTSPLPEIIRNSPVRLDTGRVIGDALRIFDEMNRA